MDSIVYVAIYEMVISGNKESVVKKLYEFLK